MLERRKAARFGDRDLVVLTWQNAFGYGKQLGNVENVSEYGLGLIVGKLLPVDTKVTISYGASEAVGIVRHQEQRDIGSFLGIQFEEAGQNSTFCFQLDFMQHEDVQQERPQRNG